MKKSVVILTLFTLLLTIPVEYTQVARAEHGFEDEDILYWTCEMHPSVRSDKPGNCPVCNMKLIPVREEKKQPGKKETKDHAKPEILYWTCGMHPSVKSDKPGNCPICNMKLVPVKKVVSPDTLKGETDTTAILRISPDAVRLARVKTTPVKRLKLVKRLVSYGNVTYNETSIKTISARVSGRIEKLFVDYTGKELKAGEPVASIYSPELISAQKELLLTRNSKLKKSTEKKLLQWGITESQVSKILRSGEVQDYLTIYSPITGTVINKNVSEGDYVKEGDILLTLADLSSVWIEAEVFERDIGFVQEGQRVKVYSDTYPGISFEGVVSFIDPVIDRVTRSTKARIVVDNIHRKLLPGAFVRTEILIPATEWIKNTRWGFSSNKHPASTKSAGTGYGTHEGTVISSDAPGIHDEDEEGVLALPRSAIINTGKRCVAFVERVEGEYEMRNVTVGPRINGYYVILGGLKEGESVVEHGNFLIDSQSQLTGFAEEAYGGAIGKESRKSSATGAHRH